MTSRYTVRIPISATKQAMYLDVLTEVISSHRSARVAADAVRRIHEKGDGGAFIRDEHTGRDYYEMVL